ncbi:NAD(P)-binding domain-containing protein [Aeromicrobium sp. PE09-221]|uniref:NAD(P)-binding domain-containing protein n=1 Tax=Aeromicrobium sp. PE09-221 TaxID=1898043 RepID=UPI001483925B|nr:NAD(P)-binding domain-containing protein [Aeromicrobium sp. PE09-221]
MSKRNVAVIGLGNMGTALARALLAADLRVTVWNRSEAKSRVLEAEGAWCAVSPASAVEESEIVVVCVADHVLVYELLDGADLQGRTVVMLTAGSADESRRLADHLRDRGAQFVEGQIGTYPDAVGTPHSRIFYAGSEQAMCDARAATEALGGAAPLGSDIGSVSGLAAAIRTYYVATSVTTVLAMEVARRHGVPLATAFAEIDLLHPIVQEGVRESLTDAGPTESSSERLTLERLADGVADLVALTRQCGLDPSMLAEAERVLELAVSRGHGSAAVGTASLVLDATGGPTPGTGV